MDLLHDSQRQQHHAFSIMFFFLLEQNPEFRCGIEHTVLELSDLNRDYCTIHVPCKIQYSIKIFWMKRKHISEKFIINVITISITLNNFFNRDSIDSLNIFVINKSNFLCKFSQNENRNVQLTKKRFKKDRNHPSKL